MTQILMSCKSDLGKVFNLLADQFLHLQRIMQPKNDLAQAPIMDSQVGHWYTGKLILLAKQWALSSDFSDALLEGG